VDSAGWARDQCQTATLDYWQSTVVKCYGRGARNWVYLPDPRQESLGAGPNLERHTFELRSQ